MILLLIYLPTKLMYIKIKYLLKNKINNIKLKSVESSNEEDKIIILPKKLSKLVMNRKTPC